MSIATAADLESAHARPLVPPLVLATLCVALADWLFYGREIGISLALFLGVLGFAAVYCNRAQTSGKGRIILIAVFVAGFLPLIEEVNLLSVSVAMLATATSVIAMTSRQATSWQRQLF
jgi:hypothetical protein